MAKKEQAQYHLECDKCGDLFWSEEGFPDPCRCPECKANPVRSKSVKARPKAQKSHPQEGLTEEQRDFKREMKYLVLKWDDIYKLHRHWQDELTHIFNLISAVRLSEGKKENSYVVANEDEPYAEDVWMLIEQGQSLEWLGYSSPQEVKEQVKQARRGEFDRVVKALEDGVATIGCKCGCMEKLKGGSND